MTWMTICNMHAHMHHTHTHTHVHTQSLRTHTVYTHTHTHTVYTHTHTHTYGTDQKGWKKVLIAGVLGGEKCLETEFGVEGRESGGVERQCGWHVVQGTRWCCPAAPRPRRPPPPAPPPAPAPRRGRRTPTCRAAASPSSCTSGKTRCPTTSSSRCSGRWFDGLSYSSKSDFGGYLRVEILIIQITTKFRFRFHRLSQSWDSDYVGYQIM